ncbi:hypothetical protein BKA67DRAFT_532736 [Truncatella angustata]|uniref:Uncharacterized protein n=1 Tax=Truncatella angustata TaxID=152316 RepID=A0A9P9A1U8_9PEZI|nr:uncharacterized protein BKA67DRAFT_532736 [Truncatella angustata]KAH6657531.1 hypothetical protein BKA67DRAFT_532736 [Truncatella angustata]
MAPTQNLAFGIRELKYPEETKTPYGYVPHFGINVTFLVVYCILTLYALVSCYMCLEVKHKRWLLRSVLVTIALCIELGGYLERVRGADNPKSYRDFLIQLTLLNSAPAFIMAAHRPVHRIGPYLCYAFGILDIAAAAFVVFGSPSAFHNISPGDSVDKVHDNTHTFLHLILAAMIAQIVTVSIFLALLALVLWHCARSGIPLPKDFILPMVGAAVLIMARAVAKIAEGGIDADEWLFLGLDSLVMVAASALLVAAHPILSWPPVLGGEDPEDPEYTDGDDDEEEEEQRPSRQQRGLRRRAENLSLPLNSRKGNTITWADGEDGGETVNDGGSSHIVGR